MKKAHCIFFSVTFTFCKLFAAISEPYGLEAMQQFERLPYLKTDTMSGQFSSYDRTGYNNDGANQSNFLYTDSHGDKVMVDMEGPGCIYSIWLTGADNDSSYLKVYFDGEASPSINMLLSEIFSGTNPPFLPPLVGDDWASSGGFYCYVPLPFSESIKITTNRVGTHFYYNVGYDIYSSDSLITTWTGYEDSNNVRNIWNGASLGTKPGGEEGYTFTSGDFNLAASGTQTLLDVTGKKTISSIKVRIPGVTYPNTQTGVDDDGRAFTGYSQFDIDIDENNSGVILVRRLDYAVANQTANIYVDNVYVGLWNDLGSNIKDRWRNSSFYVPMSYTNNKNTVTVKVVFVSSDIDWNEFYYWAYSVVGGSKELTDEIDVGNTVSEGSHNYSVSAPTWSGRRAFTYPYGQDDYFVTDEGRAFTGYSEFEVALNPSNQGIVLTRRLDYGAIDQKADVYVDGNKVGQWFNPGVNYNYRWYDSNFSVPQSYTNGKSSITIKIQFVSATYDWNEFYYWIYSVVGGLNILTDELNVGNTLSETNHNYTVNTPTWSGSRSYIYEPGADKNIVTDNGKSHNGYSQFIVDLDAGNNGMILTRRLNYTTGNQKANVYVDSQYVGQWFDSGITPDMNNCWRNSSFFVPQSYTSGKSSAAIKIEFVDSDVDWNEFYYWIYCVTGSGNVLTDAIDVGRTSSELSHAYTINAQSWSGSQTSAYPPVDSDIEEILRDVWIKCYWDNESAASVSAPIGSLFGFGHFTEGYEIRGLPLGIDNFNNMYVYFPMPFESRGIIELVNTGTMNIDDISYEIGYKDFTDDFAKVGYFKTFYNTELPTENGQDITLLDTTGSGHLVGVIQSVKGSASGLLNYLEGDERIYIDNSQSPAIHGTGTEDFYHGGWYFNQGVFSTPLHGLTTLKWEGLSGITSMYRFFLQDAVPFRRHIRASIEHGHFNDISADSYTLACYYHKADIKAILTDEVNIGNSDSESSHAYTISGNTWNGQRTETYEGDFDDVQVSDEGRAFTGYSQFTVAINPVNNGVLLRRRMDQIVGKQKAKVYVDNQLVGTWYFSGVNEYHRWRDEDFMVPACFTNSKNQITIKIEFVSSDIDWNEFYYWVYSLDAYLFESYSVGDFTSDCRIDFADFAVFALVWQSENGDDDWNQACDISEPNDGVIDYNDLVVFVENWLICVE